MPSFAISQFIILLEPLWVSAVFLLLSTGPNLDGTCWYNEILSIGFRFSDKKRFVAPDKTGMRTPDTNTAILPIFNFDFGLDGFVNGYSSAD